MEYVQKYDCFIEISKKVVSDFIQSVVAVDDRMVFERRPSNAEAEALEEPDDEVLGSEGNVVEEYENNKNSDEHNFYYQDLSLAFAKKGIVCSGFQPEGTSEEVVDAILESSKNADVTILDWQMDQDGNSGGLATKAICEIIRSDINEGGRLRLITIYTADNSQGVLTALNAALANNNPIMQNDCLSFSISKLKFCKVVVVSKEKPETELTEVIVSSFSELTAGLLSNAALASITDLRNRTHNILYKFNKDLDSAYLSHVLGLISSPDMREQAHQVAFDYAVDILSEEVKSELQTSSVVKEALSLDVLRLWPKYINDSGRDDFFGLKIGKSNSVKFGTERMVNLLAIASEDDLMAALSDEPVLSLVNDKVSLDNFKKNNIELVVDSGGNHPHLELSAIQCVRRDVETNEKHIPVIKQGAVLKSGSKYFVCIQPLCDSVRLKSDTNFTFLRVSKASSGRGFTHVLRLSGGEHLKLSVKPSSKEINVFTFSPCAKSKVIRSESSEGKFLFKDVVSKIEFEWCGEFKQAVTQEIVNSVSANISRVGFDSFEWLRMKSNG